MVCSQTGYSVSIHSLTQRETLYRRFETSGAEFQSTPSRRGRRPTILTEPEICRVSIHSLTQRETFQRITVKDPFVVSIHSLTQRETRPPAQRISLISGFNPLPHAEGDNKMQILTVSYCCFNPLPHAEGDCAPQYAARIMGSVSIHSLTQRETWVKCSFDWIVNVSIHSLTQRETPGA